MARINSLDPRSPTLSSSAVRVVGGQILEADGTAAGVYTLDVKIPAFAVLLDVIAFNETLWDAGTEALLDVGWYAVADDGTVGTVIDIDDVFDAVSLKATDLLAGESISLGWAGGKAGQFGGVIGTQLHLIDQVDGIDRFLRFTVTTTGTLGSAGETYVYAVYALPEMDVAAFDAT